MKIEESKVSLNIELDETIYHCLQKFLNAHNCWDINTAINAGTSLFLLQNYQEIVGQEKKSCTRNYLNFICNIQEEYTKN